MYTTFNFLNWGKKCPGRDLNLGPLLKHSTLYQPSYRVQIGRTQFTHNIKVKKYGQFLKEIARMNYRLSERLVSIYFLHDSFVGRALAAKAKVLDSNFGLITYSLS